MEPIRVDSSYSTSTFSIVYIEYIEYNRKYINYDTIHPRVYRVYQPTAESTCSRSNSTLSTAEYSRAYME